MTIIVNKSSSPSDCENIGLSDFITKFFSSDAPYSLSRQVNFLGTKALDQLSACATYLLHLYKI